MKKWVTLEADKYKTDHIFSEALNYDLISSRQFSKSELYISKDYVIALQGRRWLRITISL